MRYGPVLVLLLSSLGDFSAHANIFAKANVVINEVAYKGSGRNTCGGNDWVELYNVDEELVADLTNYVLQDVKGAATKNANTKTFQGVTMSPGEFLVLCRGQDFGFGIGTEDTINLLDADGLPIDSMSLPGNGANDGTETFVAVNGEYKYTALPTPGGANVYQEPLPLEEKLRAHNDAGNDFFLVGEAPTTFSKIIDIHISVPEDNLAIIEYHPAWEEWVSFDELSVFNIGILAPDEIPTAVSGGGKIRVKGQTSSTVTACLGQKNVPFSIKFDTPFLGMNNFYLRNHFIDNSSMRDHAAHTMLKAFGLPYLRTRPARLFLNGEYTGFYTLMEAPSQEYVMQRSFGVFDRSKTALFKGKTGIAACPYSDTMIDMMGPLDTENPPDKYYFERGDHHTDIPVIEGDYDQCFQFWLLDENQKAQSDLIRGYLINEKQCGLAMVEMGRMDRDLGPKSMEAPMIDFLDGTFYNEAANDLTDFVDIDQWLQNFASYAIMLNLDSPMMNINNFYLATTGGGADDWKLVQYDHNNIASKHTTDLCSGTCAPRMVYWPILRPTCESVEDHEIVGRILNREENVQKYLDYIQEFLNILAGDNTIEKLYAYGDDIKKYVLEDPFSTTPANIGQNIKGLGQYQSVEEYEKSELGRNTNDYNVNISPFLKTLQVRIEEVQKQLDAIQDGTLPRDGVYDEGSVCPDWRDDTFEDYRSAATVADDCAIPFCSDAAICYGQACGPDGNFLYDECTMAAALCNNCFPYSMCGSAPTEPSSVLVQSSACGPEYVDCATASSCFDHKSGQCAFDGEILTMECKEALPCRSCYPDSRCGLNETPETTPTNASQGTADNLSEYTSESDSKSALFVKNEDCGPELALCSQAGSCFDHTGSCAEDGTMATVECQFVLPTCKPCFPNSRCGKPSAVVDDGVSGLFVKGDQCGPERELCADAGPCFDHAISCAEDGSMRQEECNAAVSFCQTCFPNSRCGADANSEIEEGPVHESAMFVQSDTCGEDLVLCKEGANCFDHTYACTDDGSIDFTQPQTESCNLALQFCIPCYPYSRCGGGDTYPGEEGAEVQDEAQASGDDSQQSTPTDNAIPTFETGSSAHQSTTSLLVAWISSLVVSGIMCCLLTP